MQDQEVKQEKASGFPHRWKKGETGNPYGRPRKPEIELLREALEKAEKKHNKHFLEHFVELAYENPVVAIALAKKLIPDQVKGEGFENRTFILQWGTNGNRQTYGDRTVPPAPEPEVGTRSEVEV